MCQSRWSQPIQSRFAAFSYVSCRRYFSRCSRTTVPRLPVAGAIAAGARPSGGGPERRPRVRDAGRLEKSRLVRSERVGQSDRPDRKVYELTAAGRERVARVARGHELAEARTRGVPPETGRGVGGGSRPTRSDRGRAAARAARRAGRRAAGRAGRAGRFGRRAPARGRRAATAGGPALARGLRSLLDVEERR